MHGIVCLSFSVVCLSFSLFSRVHKAGWAGFWGFLHNRNIKEELAQASVFVSSGGGPLQPVPRVEIGGRGERSPCLLFLSCFLSLFLYPSLALINQLSRAKDERDSDSDWSRRDNRVVDCTGKR